MSKLDKLQRLDLLNLPTWRAATPTVVAKLDDDEPPVDWPEALKRRWAEAFLAVDWNRHPPGHLDLQRAIAAPLGLEPDDQFDPHHHAGTEGRGGQAAEDDPG